VESENWAAGIRYFVLGVGLREELSKLLLLLPLAPLLVRRGNELETLTVAACVGLGFALVENSHYFKATLGSSSVSRFLTANFFHMAATGLIGLAVVRGLREPRVRGLEALAIFGVIVFAHGLYDAALSLPALAEYSMGAMVIYILLAYQFFHELRNVRIRQPETISLTANFLCGISLIAAVTFVYLSGQLGCRMAAVLLVPEMLTTAVMVIMFLREMPASLASR
jgi:RsiW-degrading membrane proteinase PrsW (M82 family)